MAAEETIFLDEIPDLPLSMQGKLASYFGIVPRVSNSNETQRSDRITKRGCKIGEKDEKSYDEYFTDSNPPFTLFLHSTSKQECGDCR